MSVGALALWPLRALLVGAAALGLCALIMILVFVAGAARLDDGPEP
jgi:hypothetical protein